MAKRRLDPVVGTEVTLRETEGIALELEDLDLGALAALEGTTLKLVMGTFEDSKHDKRLTSHHSSHTSYNEHSRWTC